MKKRFYNLVFAVILSLGIITPSYATSHIKSSIFQVLSGGGASSAFLTRDGLVTTLHSVLPDAGKRIHRFSDIRVNIIRQGCDPERVNLISVIPKIDLALLSAPKTCSASVLHTTNYQSNRNTLMLYGYPLSLSEVIDSEVRVRNMGLRPASIYLPRNNRRGPAKNTKLISLDEHMLPGHSGAPLIADNKVVAIANGGKVGTPISWAIPWNAQSKWLAESSSSITEVNRLIGLQKERQLYHSTTSAGSEIITIEFTNGRLMTVPIQDNATIDLGDQSGQPHLIKRGYSNQVIDYNLTIKPRGQGNARLFASGAKREFGFIRAGKKLLLETRPPTFSTDANFIYDHVNGLMWTKKVVSKPWVQAESYVQRINAQGSLEYSDWRLPSKGELIILNKIAKNNPELINNSSAWYWSSNEASFLGSAIIVNGGTVPNRQELSINQDIDKSQSIRLVRVLR